MATLPASARRPSGPRPPLPPQHRPTPRAPPPAARAALEGGRSRAAARARAMAGGAGGALPAAAAAAGAPQPQQGAHASEAHSHSSTEASVGIICFANGARGFMGTLKERYSDFQVHELADDGQLAWLSAGELEAPREVENSGQNEEGGAAAGPGSAVQATQEEVDAAVAQLAELVGQEAAGGVRQLVADLKRAAEGSGGAGEGRKGAIGEGAGDGSTRRVSLGVVPDKPTRARVHALFREKMPFLDSAAENRSLAVFAASAAGRHEGRKRKRRPPKYVRFALLKRNMDSHETLNLIARYVQRNARAFSIAGTKDKRGVTCQWVTAERVNAQALAALNRKLRGVRLGAFSEAGRALPLGALSGNRFTITVRSLRAAEGEEVDNMAALVSEAVAALDRSGFVNYFGLQRFGSGAVPTHEVGAALLRGDWALAADAILRVRPGEHENATHARRLYADGGGSAEAIQSALDALPRWMLAERSLLRGMQRAGRNDLVGALSHLPRNLRSMYVHAWQSRLWNAAASRHVELYGVEHAAEGDLVFVEEDDGGSVDPVGLPEVRCVTAEEAEAKALPASRVVLPLVGARTRLPANAVADVFRELAAADAVPLDASEPAPHSISEYSLQGGNQGAYRRVIVRPKDLTFEVLQYDDPTAELTPSNFEAILAAEESGKGGGQSAATAEAATEAPADGSDAGGADGNNGSQGEIFQALRVQFTLPSSSYATMFLRELCKQDSSTKHAKSLNHK